MDMYSGEDNLKLLAKVDGNVDKKSVENEIRGLIDDVGLGQAGRKKYKKYSLGMKQRLGIAAAVLGNPDIVVLDEPTNAWMMMERKWLNQLLENRKSGEHL